ncbi:MAG: gliding motility-associated C-terminal domain-containing protein [Prevotella sp.]|nr:gliding motility-associated C-terminal domain-containing protein [Prevotella sp.]
MKNKFALALMAFTMATTAIHAQDEKPSIAPTATYTNDKGEEEETESFKGSAPVVGRFAANPSNVGSYNANYEWRFYMEGEEDNPYLVRYEEETEYTFTTAGSHRIVCYATFINGTDTVSFTKDYWANEKTPFSVSIYESELVFPNAFSPNNGDDVNNIYRAKEYKSIVEFHAYIFNRWGQKLYEWDNPAEGWDGTYKGKDVKQGVYYCLVKAKGADGRKFTIRKDVNLLRGYTLKSGSSSDSE